MDKIKVLKVPRHRAKPRIGYLTLPRPKKKEPHEQEPAPPAAPNKDVAGGG